MGIYRYVGGRRTPFRRIGGRGGPRGKVNCVQFWSVRLEAKWRGSACSNSDIIKFVRKQLLLQVLRGTEDANIRFDDLRSLLTALDFDERVKGSHHIFTKSDVV